MPQRRRGFVIRKVDYSESDLIFDFIDTDGSVISFHAKGARASKKRFSGGVLDPLQYIEIQYDQKRQSKPHLLEAKIVDPFDSIRENYESIVWGSRLLRLTSFYAQEGLVEPDLFNLLGNSLRHLNKMPEQGNYVFWHFLARLMALQGDLQRGGELAPLLSQPIGGLQVDSVNLRQVEQTLKRQFVGVFSKRLSDLVDV